MAEYAARCRIHNAPFKEGVTRWCRKSNPADTCEIDPSSLPPRQLPVAALFMLGSKADEPGWLAFLISAKQQGFGFNQPNDHDLSEERWQEVALARVSVLVRAFEQATANG